ncbi:hypothetical protein [Enterococcus hermanniensis]|uniref:Uncharacterized protein n=1 Tax=Enterococcus hermanniensis TaxID=249189 RepID=A0A1L8TPD5_9ENTE|nr:hypothetical protein [Enterococcus hermanniensis]OJG45934.1 hypothetical protein RV04_GL001700 [Enterococcus hermanniensis]
MKEVNDMLDGQLKFLDFFLNNTIEGKENEAKEILVKSFADQETNALSLEDFKQLQKTLFPLIKPEKLNEVKVAMAHFAQSIA